MATNVVIPSLGLTMEEGIIVEWLRQDGDRVDKEDPIVLIETDKATVEVSAPATGVLSGIGVKVGDAVPVGEPIAVIYEPEEYALAAAGAVAPTGGASETSASEAKEAQAAEEAGSEKAATVIAEISSSQQLERKIASPAAKKLARALNLDWRLATGTGPGGRILESNISEYFANNESQRQELISTSSPIQDGAMSSMRKAIARAMIASHQTTVPVTIHMEARMDEAVRLRTQINLKLEKSKDFKLTFDAMFAKAAAIALQEHPAMQSQWIDDRIVQPEGMNIGFAVALPDGLIVPVVHDAKSRTLLSIAEEIDKLADAAKRNVLSPKAMSGGTFTITNLGKYPVQGFTPVIQLPQSAILGIGAIQTRAIVDQGTLAIGQIAVLSLTFDHRLIDGAPAAAFLTQLKSLLEQPYQLFMD